MPITGTNGADLITGTSGNDDIFGLAGDDTLRGLDGNDTLDGGDGNDILTGGLGTDVLTGGLGSNIFLDTAAGFNGDRITDFLPGDRIQFTDLNVSNANFNLVGTTLNFNGGSIQIDSAGPGRLVIRPIASGGVEIRLQPPAHNDFNGDGRSDILWRNDNGSLSSWLGNGSGGFNNNDANAASFAPQGWSVTATGDFNGDGRVDILWRNAGTGALSDWLGTNTGGFTNNDANAAGSAPTNWTVVGSGDFNGDGRSDILWRSDTGAISNWLGTANGGFVNNDANAAGWAPVNWQVVATGDFNGDGSDDILWRNDAGALSNWLGTSAGGFVNNDTNAAGWAPTNWAVVGTGDFNGDGRLDILWRSDTGHMSNWLSTATGGFVNNDANAASWAPTSWHIASIGDFNGNAIDDILWRNDTGHLSDWLGTSAGGFVNNDSNAAGYASTQWHVQDPFTLPNPLGAPIWDY